MRKQTAPQIRNNREASSRKQSGLIAQGPDAQPSATSGCALDNHSHRTRIRRNSATSRPGSACLVLRRAFVVTGTASGTESQRQMATRVGPFQVGSATESPAPVSRSANSPFPFTPCP